MERPKPTPAVEVRRWNHADPDSVITNYIPVRPRIRPLKAVQIVHRVYQKNFRLTPSWEFCCTYRPEGAPATVGGGA